MSAPHLLDGLNPAQAQAVTHRGGPLLVVAGPGSGKTRVITHRVASLLAEGVPAHQILAVTFTNKAAEEMRERLAALLPAGSPLPALSTFHAACVKVLRRFPTEAGLTSSFGIADTSDAARLVGKALAAHGLDHDLAHSRQVASRISWAKNHGYTPATLGDDHALDDEVRVAWPTYARLLEEARLVDFDDLLLRTAAVLDVPEVRAFYAERISHTLVDEFQDTNQVQYRIARALSSGTGSITVVGDPQQSIYAWRGSFPAIVQTFLDDHPGATIVRLEENYRSTRAITSLAAAVIAGDDTGVDFTSRSVGDAGETPYGIVADDDAGEATWAATWVASQPGSCAILVRTNAQTRAFEEALTRAGVAHQVVGTLRFWERAEIKDALAWLRLIAQPADPIAFERAAGAPARGIGPAALTALADYAAGMPLPEALAQAVSADDWPLPARTRGPLTSMQEALVQVRTAAHRGPQAALGAILTSTGLKESWGKGAEATERLQNLSELVRTADGWPASIDGCRAFLESVALAGAADEAEREAKVVLMTVHAAKGREWDHVLVAGVEDGLFPSSRSTDARALAEERRLLYVAVTRARTTLVLSRARRRFRFGSWRDADASPLLAALPPDRLRWRELTPRRTDLRTDPLTRSAGRGSGTWPGARSGKAGRRYPPRPSAAPGSAQPSTLRRHPAVVTRASLDSAPPAPKIPAGPRLEPGDVVVGTEVFHATFGAGTITSVSGTRISVDFASGPRMLDVRMAPLSTTPL